MLICSRDIRSLEKSLIIMNQLLMVFVKDSKKYPVKTRLKASIGKNKSIWIYNQILNKTARVTKNLKVDVAIFH